MARLNPPVLITANALAGGEVIYLTEQQTWSPWINEGFIFNDLDTANTVMVARALEHEVVGPYLMSVLVDNGQIKGQDYRENFRSLGPTNYWHGKQAEDDDASV
jgi:hypothetical protein